MSSFDEAPPLPRQPTAISVPEEMATDQTPQPIEALQTSTSPGDTSPLPPPPKFPSLTDVGLSSATAAAEAHFGTDSAPTATEQPPAPPLANPIDPVEEEDVLKDNPAPMADPALPADIDAAIARDTVAPGTGVKKAIEVGEKLWTDVDQEELNRLLKEGQTVYVPPDVVEDDMLKVRRSHYVPVPIPHGDTSIVAGVDTTPDLRSVSTRVEQWNQVQWNQVVPRETDVKERDSVAGAVPVPVPAPIPGSEAVPSTVVEGAEGTALEERAVDDVKETPVGDEASREVPAAVQESAEKGEEKKTEGEGATDVSVVQRSEQTKKSGADVTKSIFGGNFLTVPVMSRKERELSNMGTVEESPVDMEEITKEVMLKNDSAAQINVTEDYGLQDGHADGTNDAAFFSDGSLVTCGNDGKVCIWDMEERVVESEFMPYDGEGVTMVYPLQNEDEAQTKILVTLSKSRLMRIWTVDKKRAIMLRSTQIKSSEKELYMSIPHISDELKARATAAAYAAAITTTEPPKIPKPLTPVKEKKPEEEEEEAPAKDATAAEAETKGEGEAAETKEEEEEEKGSRRFSFAKVLSFGRTSSSRKAVAS